MPSECFLGIYMQYCLIFNVTTKAIFYSETHKTTETKEHYDTTNAPTVFWSCLVVFYYVIYKNYIKTYRFDLKMLVAMRQVFIINKTLFQLCVTLNWFETTRTVITVRIQFAFAQHYHIPEKFLAN